MHQVLSVKLKLWSTQYLTERVELFYYLTMSQADRRTQLCRT